MHPLALKVPQGGHNATIGQLRGSAKTKAMFCLKYQSGLGASLGANEGLIFSLGSCLHALKLSTQWSTSFQLAGNFFTEFKAVQVQMRQITSFDGFDSPIPKRLIER